MAGQRLMNGQERGTTRKDERCRETPRSVCPCRKSSSGQLCGCGTGCCPEGAGANQGAESPRRCPCHGAFTLVELLVVVTIIALLIGVLVPAVQRAQQKARDVAVAAQLDAITKGLEMFKSDYGYYPSSLPQTAGGVNGSDDRSNLTGCVIQGAHRLAFALLGRDKMGCPAQAGTRGTSHGLPSDFSDTGPDSLTGWYYSTALPRSFDGAWNGVSGAAWSEPDDKTPRHGPYINPEGLYVVKDQSVAASGEASDGVWLLCDKTDPQRSNSILTPTEYKNHSTILYFAANEHGEGIGDTAAAGNNIYFWQDNQAILSQPGLFSDADSSTNATDSGRAEDFWTFIEDKTAKARNLRRPHNPDSFLLIARGADGLYGTGDDIVNWSSH